MRTQDEISALLEHVVCSFCLRTRDEIKPPAVLILGPSGAICSDCVRIAEKMVEEITKRKRRRIKKEKEMASNVGDNIKVAELLYYETNKGDLVVSLEQFSESMRPQMRVLITKWIKDGAIAFGEECRREAANGRSGIKIEMNEKRRS